MKRSLYNLAMKGVRILVILCVWAAIIAPHPALADDPSALSLDLYLQKDEAGNPVLKYTLGDPDAAIPVWVVLTNNAAWPLNLDPEVLEGSIDQHLVLIDPAGNENRVALESIADDMPQPIRYGERDLVPVITMEAGKSKTLKIDDVRAIFPMMNTQAGMYQLLLSFPATIYGWTLPGPGQKPLGVLDEKAKIEELETEEIQVYIVPEIGARLTVRVEDLAMPLERFRDQVPVKVFSSSTIGEQDLAVVWDKATPILSGLTDESGWADWPPQAACVPLPPEDDPYTAVAKYQGKFEVALFEASAEGWGSECSGSLEQHIFFNVPEEEGVEFSVFGKNSVWLKNGARVRSGDVGVGGLNNCVDCPTEGFEIFVDNGAWVADSQKVEGSRVKISAYASVWDVYCDQLDRDGRIRGSVYQPLVDEVWPNFPSFKPSAPGTVNRTINSGQKVTLAPGSYANITVEPHGILYLDPGNDDPGVYNINSLTLGIHAKVICEGPVEMLIAGALDGSNAKFSYIGPKHKSGYSAQDIVIYADTAVLGNVNFVRANIYANNSFVSGRGCFLKGAILAEDVTIGPWNVVKYNSVFSRTEDISLTASKFYIAWYKFVQLTWSGATTAKVDIYRNGNRVATTNNDGSFYDSLGTRPRGIFVYQVCEEGSDICSSEASVEY